MNTSERDIVVAGVAMIFVGTMLSILGVVYHWGALPVLMTGALAGLGVIAIVSVWRDARRYR